FPKLVPRPRPLPSPARARDTPAPGIDRRRSNSGHAQYSLERVPKRPPIAALCIDALPVQMSPTAYRRGRMAMGSPFAANAESTLNSGSDARVCFWPADVFPAIASLWRPGLHSTAIIRLL